MAKELLPALYVMALAKKSIAGIKTGNCKECDGIGRRRCDICGGTGEIDPANSQVAQSRALDRNQT
jgi:hypothetical protein